MRLVVWFHLFLALMVGIGPFFKGDALVLCVESDGRVTLETMVSADTGPYLDTPSTSPNLCEVVSDASLKCPNCSNCHDIFIGPARSNPAGLQSVTTSYLPDLTPLSAIDPLPLRPLSTRVAQSPPEPWRFTSYVPVAAPPVHLPSTRLLI